MGYYDPSAQAFFDGQAQAREDFLMRQKLAQNALAMQREQDLRNALVRAYTPQTRTIENSAYMSPEEIAQTIDPMAQHEARNALLTPGQTELTPEQMPQYAPLYQQKRNELLGQVREAGYDVPSRTEVVPFQPKTYEEIVASQEMAKQYQTIYAPMLERFIAPESFSREGIQQIADIYRQSGNPELMRMADTLVTIRPSSKEGEFNYVLPAVTTDDEAAQFAQQYPDLAARFGSRGVIRNIPLRITENMNGDVVGMSLEKLPSEAKPSERRGAQSIRTKADVQRLVQRMPADDPERQRVEGELLAAIDAFPGTELRAEVVNNIPTGNVDATTIPKIPTEKPPGRTPAQEDILVRSLRTQMMGEQGYKDYQLMTRQHSAIKATFDAYKSGKYTTLNPHDQIMIMTFNRMLDPASVVRESEFARTPENMAILDRAYAMTSRWMQGGILSPDERKALMQAADVLRTSAAKKYTELVNGYRDAAVLNSIDPKKVIYSHQEPPKEDEPQASGKLDVDMSAIDRELARRAAAGRR